jgi:hypothetical protein
MDPAGLRNSELERLIKEGHSILPLLGLGGECRAESQLQTATIRVVSQSLLCYLPSALPVPGSGQLETELFGELGLVDSMAKAVLQDLDRLITAIDFSE